MVLDLSAARGHSVLTLKNPDRVVIDLSDARLAPARAPRAGGSGVVKQVRMARRPIR